MVELFLVRKGLRMLAVETVQIGNDDYYWNIDTNADYVMTCFFVRCW